MSEAAIVVGKKRDRREFRKLCLECEKIASYGLKGTKNPVLCAKHFGEKPESERELYYNCTRRRCVKCNEKTPSFANPGEKTGRYCSDCRTPEMVNVAKGGCKHDGCSTRATFGFPGSVPQFCSRHAEKGMEDLYTKRCEEPGCKKYALYAKEFGDSPRFCMEHGTLRGFSVDVKSKRCEAEGCLSHACMGKRNGSKRFCSKHAEDGMVNVKAAICEMCDKRASFGVEKPTRCASHFADGMRRFLTNSRKCKDPDCSRLAYYLDETDSTPRFCSIHASEEMYHGKMKSRLCVSCNKVWAGYGAVRGTKPTHCFSCKTPEMVDIVNAVCNVCNTKRALYGLLLEPATRCADHRDSKMYKNRFCLVSGCYSRPEFGYVYPLHCFTHKKEDETNLVESKCKSCELTFYCNAESLCDFCAAPRRREKELQTLDFLNEFYGSKLYKANQVLDSGCTLARPDILFDFGDRFVCVEVDENQHKNYACENARMVDIFNSIGGSKTVFIRFNPDKYKNSKNEECFTSFTTRLRFLREYIDALLRRSDLKLLEVHSMYFDGFDGSIVSKRVIFDDSPIHLAF